MLTYEKKGGGDLPIFKTRLSLLLPGVGGHNYLANYGYASTLCLTWRTEVCMHR